MLKPTKLLFGTAGIPISTHGDTLAGIKQVRNLGLEAMELEFVRSINLSKEKAPLVKAAAIKNNIFLTCHGQYYINLNSLEIEKLHASVNRILGAAKRAYDCGANSLTFHAGFYMKQEPEKVYQKIKERIEEIVKILQEEEVDLWIRPETTGKATQWGSLKEIVKLSEEVEQVLPCIDFSHLHARTGKENTLEEFRQQLALVEDKLGRAALDNMHIHLAGIHYTEKGERHHLNLRDSDMNYQDLLKAWKEFKIKGVVISESPNIEGDALMLKREYEKLGF